MSGWALIRSHEEVEFAERDLTYARCRGWTRIF